MAADLAWRLASLFMRSRKAEAEEEELKEK